MCQSQDSGRAKEKNDGARQLLYRFPQKNTEHEKRWTRTPRHLCFIGILIILGKHFQYFVIDDLGVFPEFVFNKYCLILAPNGKLHRDYVADTVGQSEIDYISAAVFVLMGCAYKRVALLMLSLDICAFFRFYSDGIRQAGLCYLAVSASLFGYRVHPV